MNNNYNRHIGNISRAVGHDISQRYSYIINESDLTNAWLSFHDELGYPLMIDSGYRRAIVYNKKGLEKQIQNMINECIEKEAKELSDIIVNDITYQLNNITQSVNGTFIKGGNSSFNLGGLIGKALGKGLVNGFFNILDDITDTDEERKRR